MPLPIAHAGHWAAGLLYLMPVLIVVGALGWQTLKDRRAGDEDDEHAEHREPALHDDSAGPRA